MLNLSRHPTTLYQAIATQLEDELQTRYRCGDYLPSEKQLAAHYAVNRHTLCRAVDQLVEKGLVQRRQGIGILVLKRPYNYPLHAQARFSQNLLEQGSHPTSERLLAVLRPCNAEVAAALACSEGDTVIHLRTLRRVNGLPVCLINHYLPDLRWWPQLQHFCSGSLHDFIRQQLSTSLERSQTRITARRAQAKESGLLEIALYAPLLERNLPRDESAERAKMLLSRLNVPSRLWGLAPSTFSGGEQQRVNIARGFIAESDILLLDEPTASLDSRNSDAVVTLIEEARQRGAAIVGIFHDNALRERIADRLHVMQPVTPERAE